MTRGLVSVVRSGAASFSEDLVAISREGSETVVRFDDGLKLRFRTAQLLDAILDDQDLADLVHRERQKREKPLVVRTWKGAFRDPS
jgi:hypothetical protein